MTFFQDENIDNERNPDENIEGNPTEVAEESEEKKKEEKPEGEAEKEKIEESEEKPVDKLAEEFTKPNEEVAKHESGVGDEVHHEEPHGKVEHIDEQKDVEKKAQDDKAEGHLLMPNDSKIKFVQDSFGFSNEKTTFEAPKFHPYLLMKNYSVQYMDPIIKRAKPRRFLCCS